MLPVTNVLDSGVAAAAYVSLFVMAARPFLRGPVARTKLQSFLVRH